MVDDFIYTIFSDEEEVPDEPDVKYERPRKKKKTAQSDNRLLPTSPENAEDDGLLDSDFEFMPDEAPFELEDWGFEDAKAGSIAKKNGANLDEIISRRRDKSKQKSSSANNDAESNDRDGLAELSDSEVTEDSAQDERSSSDAESDESDSGDATAAMNRALDADEDDVKNQDSEDAAAKEAEEEAKRKDFFAADETTSKKKSKAAAQASFLTMSLSRPILRGLQKVGFANPTPIQGKTIPHALQGKDIVGGAVTGSGKTAAFLVPILERLLYRPRKVPRTRVVILTPTRELAIQCHSVAKKLAALTDIKFTLAVGGLSLKTQEAELRLRPDVIIATPGRFIDHMRNATSFAVDTVEILVLDEADRMLEDGFADELNEILTTLPKSRQTMLFSATMTSSVDRLIRVGLNKPVRLMVDSQNKTAGTLTQEFVRLRPTREDKRMGYLLWLCKNIYTSRVIIFFRQKKLAHRMRIVFGLVGLSSAELHGSMSQNQRIASVEAFRDGKVSFLLATDLASRGLDIKGIDTVINFEVPQTPEIYLHRVGRTARAGRRGTACTIVTEADRKVVRAINKAATEHGARLVRRPVDAAAADKWQAKIDSMADDVEAIYQEEREEKQLGQVEMQVKKGENLIEHEAEIKSRPKRTWFESERDKRKARAAGRAELNGVLDAEKEKLVREHLKKKHGGKFLSNKDKKKLDAREERKKTRPFEKTQAMRLGPRQGAGVVKRKAKAKSRWKPSSSS